MIKKISAIGRALKAGAMGTGEVVAGLGETFLRRGLGDSKPSSIGDRGVERLRSVSRLLKGENMVGLKKKK